MNQMVMTNPYETYRRQGILTASPIDLVVMLYDGLRKDMVLAQRAIRKHDIAAAHGNLMKAQAIVTELLNSLDMNYELSDGLSAVYEFILQHLQEANLKKDETMIGEALELVEELRGAWKAVAESQRGAQFAQEDE